MEIKLTIGVTPALEDALRGLGVISTFSSLASETRAALHAIDPSFPATPQHQAAPQIAPAPVAPVQSAPIPVAPQQPAAPVAPVPQQPATPVVPAPLPTASTSYSMDQLAVAATQLMDAGKRNELLQLLASFGVNALTELPKEQYGNFATQLRGLGAKI